MKGASGSWVIVLQLVAMVAMVGCGSAGEREHRAAERRPDAWREYRDPGRGYAVRFPAGWHRATQPVAPSLMDPREILSLATFPLRHRRTNCEAFGGAARSAAGRDDVFVTVQERGYDPSSRWSDFPPRPERFGSADSQPGEPACGDARGSTVHWQNFTDAGRHFHTLVVIGPAASARAREQVWRILDSLHLEPRTPEWPASE